MLRVLLQCDDTYFVKAFGNYASANCQNIEFICFTTSEKAIDYLSKTALRLDAVLATQEVLSQVGKTKAVRMRVSERTVFSNQDMYQINIYQSGSAIISDIKNTLSLSGKQGVSNLGDRAVRFVTTYSVQGGCGKTVLSYALAAAAARSGKQVLYLNLEPFPALGQLYDHEFSSSMDDLLFALKGKRDLAPVLLDTMERNQDHVMVLPPFRFAGDLLSLTQEDMTTLLKALAEKTNLDYIFVDLPVGFQQMDLWVLELSSCVLQIYSDDMVGREHLHRTAEDVYFKNLPIPGTLMTVLNKCRQKNAEETIAGKIPHSDSLQQGRRVADVQERNPAFLKSCIDLLEKIS